MSFLPAWAALVVLFYSIFFFPYPESTWPHRVIDAYLRVQTAASGWFIGWFDPGAAASGTLISGAFPMRIVKACSSLDAQALFAATVLVARADWRWKALGLVAGVVALNAFNVLRIATLYWVGSRWPASFDVVHEEVLPLGLLVLCVLVLWVWTPKRLSHA